MATEIPPLGSSLEMPRPAPLQIRPSREAYPSWLRRRFRIDAMAKGKAHYDAVAAQLSHQVIQSPFWQDLCRSIQEIESDYSIATNFGLLDGPFPDVAVKEWSRFLDKTYRHNVRDNANWPGEPDGGWLEPPSWFVSVKDVVRTLFIVKYMDGVHSLGRALERVAARHGLDTQSNLMSTDLGYYAAHVVVTMPLRVTLQSWDVTVLDIPFEVQVTTQVQEVIRKLLHEHYEASQEAGLDAEWKWDWEGGPFSANYLGHILHYLEGQIMRVRQGEGG